MELDTNRLGVGIHWRGAGTTLAWSIPPPLCTCQEKCRILTLTRIQLIRETQGASEVSPLIAFLLAALVAGIAIVYVVPFVTGYFAKVPGASGLVNNRFAQLLLIGAVVLLTLHLFLAIARKVD